MNQTSTAAVDPMQNGKRLGYGALDLSSGGLASFVLLLAPFPGDLCWRLFSYFWMPGTELQGRLKANEAFWFESLLDGHVVRCPERESFVPFVLKQVASVCAGYVDVRISGIAFDRFLLSTVEPYLRMPDIQLPEFVGCSMGSNAQSAALEALGQFEVGESLRCAENPVLTYCFNSVRPGFAGNNLKLWGRLPDGHIGGAVATLMAINLSRGVIDPPSAPVKWRQVAGTGGSHAGA